MWPVFIGWINVFKTSPRLSRDVFRTLKTDCQICVFICPDKLLREKIFSWKNVQFGKVCQNGGRGGREIFFWVLWKKRSFGRKLSGELSEGESTFPDGLFEERHVFPKTFAINKSFQTFSTVSVFWHVFQKSIPVSKWTFWGIFFFKKYLFAIFFQILSRILSYFDHNTSTDCQNCVLSV